MITTKSNTAVNTWSSQVSHSAQIIRRMSLSYSSLGVNRGVSKVKMGFIYLISKIVVYLSILMVVNKFGIVDDNLIFKREMHSEKREGLYYINVHFFLLLFEHVC